MGIVCCFGLFLSCDIDLSVLGRLEQVCVGLMMLFSLLPVDDGYSSFSVFKLSKAKECAVIVIFFIRLKDLFTLSISRLSYTMRRPLFFST